MTDTEYKSWQQELNWNMRLHALITISTMMGFFIFNAVGVRFTFIVVVGSAMVLFTESFASYLPVPPKVLRTIRLLILLVLLAVLLIAAY